MKRLLLLLSLMISLDALGAEELNQVAHKKCELRSGNHYKDCYRYFSRIYPTKNTDPISSNNKHQPLIVNLKNLGDTRTACKVNRIATSKDGSSL